MMQVFSLSPKGDPTRLSLTSAEGYLLSRIDGSTPWRLLREIGGIPPEQVDACLTRWLEQGLLEVVGGEKRRPASATGPKPSAGAAKAASKPSSAPEAPRPMPTAEIDESALDAALDLSLETQRRILEFEACLASPYHELLGVPRGAEPKVVKRAYFRLSKEFHPDRYFRRRIGGYGARLERIFKKVLEAHEMLSDPDLCQVENHAGTAVEAAAVDAAVVPGSGAASGAPDAAVAPGASASDPGAERGPRRLSKRERLRQRMPFKINHAALAARRARAEEIFRAAELSQRAGRLQEAEASIRIAITFDPARAEFKEALGALRIEAAGARASKLLEKPSDRMSNAELLDALKLIEEVLPYRPHDPQLNERAARICLQLGKLDDALEYAETLVERTPDAASCHTLVGRIHRKAGDLDEAVAAFERALKYDSDDQEARRGLAAARIGAHDRARGGMS